MKTAILVSLVVCATAYADTERCTRGVAFAKKNDLPRAHLYLMGCTDAEFEKAARDVAKKLRDSDLSSIVISVEPEGLTLQTKISALPGETFTAPATIWVKAGTYELTATNGELTFKQTVSVREFSRTSTLFDTDNKPKATAPKAGNVNFDDEGALEQKSGPPPAVKRGSLMSKKYLGQTEGPTGDLVDPLAYRPVKYTTRPMWLGLRLGGGMFDDSTSDARAGAALAATFRFRITPRFFYSSRMDYSRRTGQKIDTLGANIGAGAMLFDNVALIGQLRGEFRFVGDTMDANTLGASGALNLEVALPSTPMTIGVRFEQGITEVARDTRDRALLLEVGADWR